MGSFNVVGSQIDVASVVSQLMLLERQPVVQMENQLSSMQSKINAYQTFNTRLSALANNVNTLLYGSTTAPLLKPTLFNDKLSKSIFTSGTATSSNENILKATASGVNAAASYSITINQMARAQSSVSRGYTDINQDIGQISGKISIGDKELLINLDASKARTVTTGVFDSSNDEIGTGTITINGSKGSGNFVIGTGETLNDLAAKLNSADIGITASIVANGDGYSLEIKADDAGTANSFTIEINDPSEFSENLVFTQTQEAKDTTLKDLQQEINNANIGVNASIIYDGSKYMMMLASKETGAANAFEVTGILQTALDFKTLSGQEAQNAKLSINGIDIVSNSNTVKDAIEGVTLNLNGVTAPGQPVKLDIGVDSDSIVSSIKDIIAAYNSVSSYITSQFTYNETSKSSGVLAGDSTLRLVQSRLQSIVTASVPEGGDYKTMGSIGISFSKEGLLVLDEAKLKEALSNDTNGVAAFFLGSDDATGSTSGMLTKLGDALKGLTDPLSNPIKSAMDGVNNSIKSIQKTIEAYEVRLEAKEILYYAQFSAADEALRMMNVTMSSISSMLASLSVNSSSS